MVINSNNNNDNYHYVNNYHNINVMIMMLAIMIKIAMIAIIEMNYKSHQCDIFFYTNAHPQLNHCFQGPNYPQNLVIGSSITPLQHW